jgi:hypothetical protein
MMAPRKSQNEESHDSDDETEDDDGFGHDSEDHTLSEQGTVLGDSADSGGSDVFLTETGTDTSKSNCKSSSNSN